MVPQLTVRIHRKIQPDTVRGSRRGHYSLYSTLDLFKIRKEDTQFLPLLADNLIRKEVNRLREHSIGTAHRAWSSYLSNILKPEEFVFLIWIRHRDTWHSIYPSIGALERYGSTAPSDDGKVGYIGGQVSARMEAPSRTLFKRFIKIHKPHGSPLKVVPAPQWQLGG